MTLLEIRNLNKYFGGNHALKNINLIIKPGEIHAIVGENGAGKSTIIKILNGVYQPTNGEINWENNSVRTLTPKKAKNLGIEVVHQDRQLIPYFTGLENLFLHIPYPKKAGILIDWKRMRSFAEKIQKDWGINLPLSKLVSDMSPAEKTVLEILRATMTESKLLILDEPTASLTDKESEFLFSFIRRLKKQGVAIIYVSHRLEEVVHLSDRVTVMIGGRIATTIEKQNVSKDILIKHMTGGQEISTSNHQKSVGEIGKVLLDVNNLTSKDGIVKKVNFKLQSGQILGIYGLAGSGRTELLECIYGLRAIGTGNIEYQQEKLNNVNPSKSINNGVVLIPENRHDDALIMQNTIRENMTLPILNKYVKSGIIRKKLELKTVRTQMNRFLVKAVNSEQQLSQLSGGNQQKIVFAKALLCEPTIYLCDEPTQAVDVMTRVEIHSFLREQVNEGKGVIFVSSDLDEVLEISDEIMVMSDGQSITKIKNVNLRANDILEICYKKKQEVI